MSINPNDISFVIQGELKAEITPRTIDSIRRFFPGAEIVLATYIGSDVAGLDYDKIALVADPGFYQHDDRLESKPNNVNRQIQTTLAGLKASTRKYAFKIRSDFILTGRGFLDFFSKFPKYDCDYKVFNEKILSCVFFARNPRTLAFGHYLLFHPSDLVFFGLCEDLINLYDIPFMNEEDSVYFELNGNKYCRYAPEQHIWVNCLRKNGKKKIDFDSSVLSATYKDIKETEKYAVSNFVYLDWTQFCLKPPEHLARFSKNDFASCITHVEWQKLYKKYLDDMHELPIRDTMREFINNEYKILKIYGKLSRIIASFFPTKFLKNFRHNLRESIMGRCKML
ncbi:MAG: WavE lipopolysaccharide synthesis family protein [Rickettsiales bacterium]|jgi:hypothetical protein|nr:WavE lipopolysaccharide synthesis family protein [Rickettsiales bacterium]